MDCNSAGTRAAQRQDESPAKRAKAARGRRRARAEKAEVPIPAPARERSPEQRQRDLIASLLRVAETQTRALEEREAPVPSSELKAAVDVLERLQRMQAAGGGCSSQPEKPVRSLSELRDELYNHLCRIRRERGLDPVPPELMRRPRDVSASEQPAQEASRE